MAGARVGSVTNLVITVDTEVRLGDSAQDNPDTQIYGRVGSSGSYGITYIMDRLSKHRAFCTFFVNVYDTDLWGREVVAGVTREISERSFDVQLHTHVERLDGNGRFSKRVLRKGFSECSFEQQQTILAVGIARIQEWTGKLPSWHRAGDLFVSQETLRACEQVGLFGDSSFLFGWPQCMGLEIKPARRNLPHRFGNLYELPVTTFQTLPIFPYFRHLDLDACTLKELIVVTKEAVRWGMPYLVLLMHSFSLVKKVGGKYVCHEENCTKFDGFLDFASHLNSLTIGPLCDLRQQDLEAACSRENPASRELYTGFFLTYERAWRHWDRGLKNKLFALLPLLVLFAALVCVAVFLR